MIEVPLEIAGTVAGVIADAGWHRGCITVHTHGWGITAEWVRDEADPSNGQRGTMRLRVTPPGRHDG